MKNSLSIKTNYSADDYLRATRFIENQSFFVILPSFIFISTILCIYLFSNDYDEINYLGVFVFAIVLSILTTILKPLISFFSLLLVKFGLRKQIKSSPMLQEEMNITFSDFGIELSNELFSTKTNWKSFIKAAESENDIFLFISPKVANFFPKSAFFSEEDEDYVRCLINVSSG